MDLHDASTALKYTDWDALRLAGEDTTFPVVVYGEAVLAKVVEVVDKEDSDYDVQLSVTVQVGDDFFQKEGWGDIGSSCYGEYEPSWGALKKVRPVEKVVTNYVPV